MARTPLRDDWPESRATKQLLDLRMADLPLAIEGTLAARIAQLRAELDDARPALPAALLPLRRMVHAGRRDGDRHPLLSGPSAAREARGSRRCSRSKAASTSGACASCVTRPDMPSTTPSGCGCSRQRRHMFGSPSKPYPEFYTPKPYSKSFVLHLDAWYAQSHPDEDFAETFAVWLTPNSEWRQRYAGWQALNKLEYMDALMDSLREHGAAGATTPRKSIRSTTCARRCASTTATSGATTASTTRTSTTATCGGCSPTRRSSRNITAAQFIARIRRPVRRVVAELDRHLPVHDRPGARRHDRALPRAEAAPRRARRTGAAGVHRAADGAGDELPAQRRPPAVLSP